MRFVRGKVLDLGCGAGRVGLHLQSRGHEVVGVGAHPDLVRRWSEQRRRKEEGDEAKRERCRHREAEEARVSKPQADETAGQRNQRGSRGHQRPGPHNRRLTAR